MDKIKEYLKTHGLSLGFMILVLVALGFVISGAIKQFRSKTVYVLPDPSQPDSVFSQPAKTEQSAQARWDSLSKIQPR
ncbi:hypothetical protein [Spirosoma litoris]